MYGLGGVGGVGVRGFDWGFTNPVGTGGVWDMCRYVCGLEPKVGLSYSSLP